MNKLSLKHPYKCIALIIFQTRLCLSPGLEPGLTVEYIFRSRHFSKYSDLWCEEKIDIVKQKDEILFRSDSCWQAGEKREPI